MKKVSVKCQKNCGVTESHPSVRLELASQYFRIIVCDVGEAPTLRIRGAKESFKTFVNSRDKFVNIPVDEEVRMFLSPKTAV